MYARIHTAKAPEGAIETHTYRRLAGDDELTLSLFDTQAAAASDPTAEWYEVESDDTGAAPTAGVAAFLHFDGPLSAEVKAAADRANRDRIAPAMHDHPGFARVLVLWQPQRRSAVVLTMAESVESLEEGQRKIGSMELLPGEDPALLPGPDRIEIFRTVAS
ncbi:hypothetical protein [Alloactinosynnema sp. L-07]|uniref:hypothetical protein n=1 Tax=Alloactinosynnema sp. L-07 TaxID=1653480 RepID=UPI00065EF933|nr:hypothetical protein [Alloactinosynnema sp. L-07]CRK61937.1 hypothetical protein [Alloactinosynnema sp. L-07]